jgi:large subunit ribosomal protein L28
VAKCEICGKLPRKGIQLSHSHIKSKRVWAPNIRRVKVNLDGHVKRINVCTRCLRSGKVSRTD